MSDRYDAVKSFIETARENGIEPDRVVVPAEDWPAVKEQAEQPDTDGITETRISGVMIVWSQTRTQPVAEVTIDD